MSWRRLLNVITPNTSVDNFSLRFILQDLHQNFTDNEQKQCKNQSVNIRDEFHFSGLHQNMNNHFARDPLCLYFNECQKNSVVNINYLWIICLYLHNLLQWVIPLVTVWWMQVLWSSSPETGQPYRHSISVRNAQKMKTSKFYIIFSFSRQT